MNSKAKLRLRSTRYARPIGPATLSATRASAERCAIAQLRSCDTLAEKPRIRYEAPRKRLSPEEASPTPSWLCAHAKPRHELCSACGRGEAEIADYRRHMLYELAKLRAKGVI
jgi:hypothetical protein